MKNQIDRRTFIKIAGSSSAAVCLSPRFAFAGMPKSDRKIRVGVVGGRFGLGFYFNEHPNCTVEAVSDLREDRRTALMKTYQCKKSYESLEVMLHDPKIEAIGLFTGAPDHARQVIMSLNAGKHVLCAVPVALNLQDCQMVLETVKRTGLTYMMAETTTYMQSVITAKKFFRQGDFGNVFSSASWYHHPGQEPLWFDSEMKPTWRHGLPPMLYPTHVTAHIVAVTGERLISASCLGWGDDSPILKGNMYHNPFWNERAFFKTDKGNSFLGELFWKGALVAVERGEWLGDKMSFYTDDHESGLGDFKVVYDEKQTSTDSAGFIVAKPKIEKYQQEMWWKTDMLPESMRHDSAHGGSHTFITHEFISSIIENRKPEIDIHESLAYTVPGIIAHDSALKNGELMNIPTLT